MESWVTEIVICDVCVHDLTKQHEGFLNIERPSDHYRNSHYKDKTVSRPSYLYNGISYTWISDIRRVIVVSNGSRPLVRRMMTTKRDMPFSSAVNDFKYIFDDIVQNDQRGLKKYLGTSRVKLYLMNNGMSAVVWSVTGGCWPTLHIHWSLGFNKKYRFFRQCNNELIVPAGIGWILYRWVSARKT